MPKLSRLYCGWTTEHIVPRHSKKTGPVEVSANQAFFDALPEHSVVRNLPPHFWLRMP